MIKRKRGAQPGNSNAFKHGLYSHAISEEHKQALDAASPTDLTEAVAALRILLNRYLEAEKHTDPKNVEARRQALVTVCMAANQVAVLTRIQARGQRFLAERDKVLDWFLNLPDPSKKHEN